jgi:hypothetical protein
MLKNIVIDTGSLYAILVLLSYDRYNGDKYLLKCKYRYYVEKHVFENEVKYDVNDEKFHEFCIEALLKSDLELEEFTNYRYKNFLSFIMENYFSNNKSDNKGFFIKLFEELLNEGKLGCSELNLDELLNKHNYVDLMIVVKDLDLKNFRYKGKEKDVGEIVSFLYAIYKECDSLITLDSRALFSISGKFKVIDKKDIYYHPYPIAILRPTQFLERIIDNKKDLLNYLYILKQYIELERNSHHEIDYIDILIAVIISQLRKQKEE